jgi:diaminohydroxyphosphoribosylaminopyrimidine deaminase/5-amino-6-(5-phosphoribosylamino)uracil reductase
MARPLLDWPLSTMSEAPELEIIEFTSVGRDWHIVAKPVSGVPAPLIS